MTLYNKILLGPSSFAEMNQAPLQKILAEGYEVIENPVKRKLTKPELFELLTEGVVGLIAGLEPLDSEVIEKSHLKVISRCGSGVSNVDLHAAEKKGVKVFSTPNGPTIAVAELALASLLALLRKLPQMNQDLHEKTWNKQMGTQLRGKKAAVIGFGRIGQAVANMLLSFGVEVITVDPFKQCTANSEIKFMDLKSALPLVDIVTLHCAGEKVLIGEEELKLMKPASYLLNAARGSLVDEQALIRALENGRIVGAWFDTFWEEPYYGLLCKYPQVILTPHVGSYTLEGRLTMEMDAVDNLLKGLSAC